jgi:uncharacterized protein YjbJ (UPF0337 family)
MDKNRVIGAGKQISGSMKQAAGKLVGDVRLQSDGKAEQAEGTPRNAEGSAIDTLKNP